MHVLFINPVGVEVGGVQKILLELFKGAIKDQAGFQFSVVVPRIGQYEREYLKLGIKVHAFPISIIRRSLNPVKILLTLLLFVPNVFQLVRIIKRDKVDLVHTQKMNTLVGDVAARFAGIPVIHSSHEIALSPKWLYERVAALILHLSDRVVVTCIETRKMFPKKDKGKVQVIHNGFDINQFDGPFDAPAIRREFSIPEESIVIGTGGRIAPSKGSDVFLQAIAEVIRKFPEAKFILIGDIIMEEDRPYKDKVYRMKDELKLEKCLTISGFRKDYHAVLAAMDVFVLPSLYDTLPSIVIEAMALSKPVVATRVGGVPEQVKEGVSGILIPPGDSKKLADGIIRLIEDRNLMVRMGKMGRQRVETLFSLEQYIHNTLAMYREFHTADKTSREAQ